MRKGQKTQKKLEFRLHNKENRQKAGLKSCFWALIGTNWDESAFLGRWEGRRVSVSKSVLSRRVRDGWQIWHSRGCSRRASLWSGGLPQLQLGQLRCPETHFIFHEKANFLFSAFSIFQGETKTPKRKVCFTGNFAFLPDLKIGTFLWKLSLWVTVKTSHFVRLALYFFLNPWSNCFFFACFSTIITRKCKKCLDDSPKQCKK